MRDHMTQWHETFQPLQKKIYPKHEPEPCPFHAFEKGSFELPAAAPSEIQVGDLVLRPDGQILPVTDVTTHDALFQKTCVFWRKTTLRKVDPFTEPLQVGDVVMSLYAEAADVHEELTITVNSSGEQVLCNAVQRLFNMCPRKSLRLLRREKREPIKNDMVEEGIWFNHHGGEIPVPHGTEVRVRFRSDDSIGRYLAHQLRWNHLGSIGDIMKYCVVGT